jgi:hypothetical protein
VYRATPESPWCFATGDDTHFVTPAPGRIEMPEAVRRVSRIRVLARHLHAIGATSALAAGSRARPPGHSRRSDAPSRNTLARVAWRNARGGRMQSQLRPVLALALVVATTGVARGACNVAHELSRLAAAPAGCTQAQLHRLRVVLGNRVAFRETLDLPLAQAVLEERTCPSVDELRAFFDAWRALDRTGHAYTIKRYCSTPQTYYGLRFPYPDKPLDDAEVAALAADIDALEHRLVPALVTKSSLVSDLLQ